VNNNTVAVCNICDYKLLRGNNPKSFSTSPFIQHLSVKYPSGKTEQVTPGLMGQSYPVLAGYFICYLALSGSGQIPKNAVWRIPNYDREVQVAGV